MSASGDVYLHRHVRYTHDFKHSRAPASLGILTGRLKDVHVGEVACYSNLQLIRALIEFNPLVIPAVIIGDGDYMLFLSSTGTSKVKLHLSPIKRNRCVQPIKL